MIRDFKLMQSHGKKWIASPARPYQDQSGAKKFFAFVTFREGRKDAFDAAILKLLEPLLAVAPSSSIQELNDELPF